MASFAVGNRISYRTVDGNTIHGKVLGFSGGGKYIEWRVTSRKSRVYLHGTTEKTDIESPFLERR